MKKHMLLLAIPFMLLSCAEQLYVSTDFDKEADFSSYQTYGWAQGLEKPGQANPMFDNELNRKRIMAAIDQQAQLIGLQRSDASPDILIDFHISIDQRTDYMVHDDYPFRYRYWTGYEMASYTVKKGALVIHMVDTKKQQLVWQGVGTKTLADIPPQNVEERINDAIRSIFSGFPRANN